MNPDTIVGKRAIVLSASSVPGKFICLAEEADSVRVLDGPNLHRFVASLLLFLVYPQGTAALADSAEWVAAKQLAQQIQTTTPTVSSDERKQFLAIFSNLQSEYERLKADERSLTTRLSADQDALRQQSTLGAEYEKKRATWQTKLIAHNARCNRTFTSPAEVARCDQSGSELAKDKEVLDAREAELAKRTIELRARQAESTALVTKLDDSYGTWEKRLESDFNAPLRKALARKVETTTLRITVKSFIKTVDLSSMSAESRPGAERMFAWFTNRNFSEDPVTPAPNSKDFRLWSQIVVIATCRGDTITSWKMSKLAHRGGRELQALDAETSVMEPLVVTPTQRGPDELESLACAYAIKGKPNELTLSSFRAVRPRTCNSIWHRVSARLTCREGKAQIDALLSGSQFPSHSLWTNAEIKTSLGQAAFSSLWDCDPAAPDLVR